MPLGTASRALRTTLPRRRQEERPPLRTSNESVRSFCACASRRGGTSGVLFVAVVFALLGFVPAPGALCQNRGDETKKVREEALSPRHRGGSEVSVTPPGVSHTWPGIGTAVPASPSSPVASGRCRPQSPMAAAESRDPLQVNARPQALPALRHQTLKSRGRGTCSQGPGVQDGEAVVGAALFRRTV